MAPGIKTKIIIFVFLITFLVVIVTTSIISTGVIDYTSSVELWSYILGITFFVSLSGALFAYYLFRPIEQLIIGSQLLAAGKYEQDIKTMRKDEFGRLVEAFNSVSKKLKTATAKSRQYSDMIAQEKCKTDHIIDSMTEGVIVTDVNYRIVLFNSTAQQIFHLEEEKIRNKHIIHFFKAYGMDRAIEKFPALEKENLLPMKNVEPTITEIKIEKPRKMVLKVSIAPVLNEKKFPSGIVIVIDDITRRKEIEEMKTEFVSNVSHELRTPLTSILGFTSVLLNGKMGELNEKQKKSLATVQMESQRLSKIIEDLLDLSRLESKRTNLKFEPVNLVEVLNNTQAINFPKNKGIKFEILAPESLPGVNADKTKMTQVFTNLISNAVKFTKEKKR
ncbi:MAG: sensor histidine kinase [Nanoarchaeota archaeon]